MSVKCKVLNTSKVEVAVKRMSCYSSELNRLMYGKKKWTINAKKN